MHPHATIAYHNLGIDFVNNTCVSQQFFVLFNINGRIRLLSLMSESLKGIPFVSLRIVSVYYLSHVMSKPAFCICENKGADQLRDNRAADQHLCFRFINSAILLLNQRTNGPVNAHLISWPSKAQNIQNLKNIW